MRYVDTDAYLMDLLYIQQQRIQKEGNTTNRLFAVVVVVVFRPTTPMGNIGS